MAAVATPRPLSPITESNVTTPDSSTFFDHSDDDMPLLFHNGRASRKTSSSPDSEDRLPNMPHTSSSRQRQRESDRDMIDDREAASTPRPGSRQGSATPVRMTRFARPHSASSGRLVSAADQAGDRGTKTPTPTPTARPPSPLLHRSLSPGLQTTKVKQASKTAKSTSAVATTPPNLSIPSSPPPHSMLYRSASPRRSSPIASTPSPRPQPAASTRPNPGRSAIPVRTGHPLPSALPVSLLGRPRAASPVVNALSVVVNEETTEGSASAETIKRSATPPAAAISSAPSPHVDAVRPRSASAFASRPPRVDLEVVNAQRSATPNSLPKKPRPVSAQHFTPPLPRPGPMAGTPSARPLSFQGSMPLTRGKSLLEGHSRKAEQGGASLMATLRRGESSIDVSSRAAGIVTSMDRQDRPDRHDRARRTSSMSSHSPGPPGSFTPVDDEATRSASDLPKRRRSLRFSSLISRLGSDAARRLTKSPTPSPLSVVTTLPEMEGDIGPSALRSAVRLSGAFGIPDDGSDTSSVRHYPYHHHRHRRTSDGSIVEGALARVLYPANSDQSGRTVILSDDGEKELDVTPIKKHMSTGTFGQVLLAETTLEPVEMDECGTPELSRSSSEHTTHETHQTVPSTSPCSTFVYPPPPGSSPEILLLLASHMLTTHAATLLRHAETMGEATNTMRAMANESLDWGTRLMEAANANTTLPEPAAALGLVNLQQAHTLPPFSRIGFPPSLGTTAFPTSLTATAQAALDAHTTATQGSRRRASWVPDYPAPPPPTQSVDIALAAAPPTATLTATATASPTLSAPATTALIAQADRLGREGWADLRAAEDVWNRAMEDLRGSMPGVEVGPTSDVIPALDLGQPACPSSSSADEAPPQPCYDDQQEQGGSSAYDSATSLPPAVEPSPAQEQAFSKLSSFQLDTPTLPPPAEIEPPSPLSRPVSSTTQPTPSTSGPASLPSPPRSFATPSLSSPLSQIPTSPSSALSVPSTLSPPSSRHPSLVSMIAAGLELMASVSLDDDDWYSNPIGPHPQSHMHKVDVANAENTEDEHEHSAESGENEMHVHLADAASTTIVIPAAPVQTAVKTPAPTSSPSISPSPTKLDNTPAPSPATTPPPAPAPVAITPATVPTKLLEPAATSGSPDDKNYSFTDMVEVVRRPSNSRRKLSLRNVSDGKDGKDGKKRWFGLRWTTQR